MKRGKLLLLLVGFVFLMGFVSAVTCNPQTISSSFQQGTPTTILTFCSNPSNSSVSVSKTGTDFTLDSTSLSSNAINNSVRVTFNENASVGTHSGSINFGDGSTPIPILFSITSPPAVIPTGCSVDIFPTTLTGIKIQQGEIKSRTIQLNIPNCYGSPVMISGVSLASDEQPIQLGEISTGTLQPGGSVNIPLDINAVGVSTGAYQDTLQFLLYNSTGNKINVPSVSIGVQVTSGISPIANLSLSDLPSCSLSAIQMTTNNTYQMICSRPNPNIDISAIIDSFYLKGVGVDESSSQFIYTFKPINIGNTIFKAQFLYKNNPVGDMFNQTIRIISSGGSSVSGTTFNFNLYQKGIQKNVSVLHEGDLIIQLKDNQTGNIIDNYKIYSGGVQINNSLSVVPGVNYQLTATSPGYNDNSLNFNITSIPSVITINPNQQSYFLGQTINITTDTNATLYIDGVQIASPYLFTTLGVRTLKASKEGYTDTTLNLTVNAVPSINVISPEFKDWGKGKDVTMKLSNSGVWNVTFELLSNNVYSSPVSIASGVGDSVSFKTTDIGRYVIYLDKNMVGGPYRLENKGIWSWVTDNWGWLLVGVAVIFLGWFLFGRGGSEEGETTTVGY
mgnify:CR=1 FL=1